MAGIDLTGMDPWSSVGGDFSGSTSPSSASTLSTLGGIAGSAFGGPLGGMLGSAVGGLFGGDDKEAERHARQEAYKNRLFQERMVDKQYAYSKEMTQNAMGWRVKDLIRAGLNPMLAGINQQGAQSFSGSAASGSVPNYYASGVSKANSALMAAQQGRENALTAAALAKTIAETRLTDAQTGEVAARTDTYAPAIEKTKQEVTNMIFQMGLTRAETENAYKVWEEIQSRTDLNVAEKVKILKHEIPKLDAETARTLAEIPFERVKGRIGEGLESLLHLPEASKFQHSAISGVTGAIGSGIDFIHNTKRGLKDHMIETFIKRQKGR